MAHNYYGFMVILIALSVFLDAAGIIILIKQRKRYSISINFYRAFNIYLFASIAFTICFFLYFIFGGLPQLSGEKMRWYFTMFGFIFLLQIPKLLYQLIWLIEVIIKKIFKLYSIPRVSLALSSLLFLIIVYGMLWGKTDFTVKHVTITSDHLPKAFDGFRMIQVSDIHLGSFYDENNMLRVAKIINEQKADVVFFTGDLINVTAYEALDYVKTFQSIKAPFGKYSILGNHDMNDYRKIDKSRGGVRNIKNVITINRAMGFDILLNEHRFLIKDSDTIALIGVMNWGKPPFKQYGKLGKALRGADKARFKILLSHDPSHWTAKVLPETNIDLTLSGHTHGFQFGINCWGIRWSPIKGLYKHWLGLYEENGRYLYVNAGLGFLGIPARAGIRPEITVIELRKK